MKYQHLLPVLALLFAHLNGPAQSLHAILVADTQNPNEEFAQVCRIDSSKMHEEMKMIADSNGLKLILYPVAGADFNSGALTAVLESLRMGEKDVCFFYYSGAAFCDSTETEKEINRSLRLGKKGDDILSTASIFPALKKKNAGLNVFLVDGCALIRRIRVDGLTRGASQHGVYKSLFSTASRRPENRTIRLFSSQCTQYSYGDTTVGSVFTNAFLDAIDHFVNTGARDVSWNDFFTRMHDTTYNNVKNSIRRKQTPVLHFDVTRP